MASSRRRPILLLQRKRACMYYWGYHNIIQITKAEKIRTNNSTNKQNFSKPIPSIFSIFSRLVGGHFRFLFSLIKHRLYTHNAASFFLFFFQRITQSSTDFVLKKKLPKNYKGFFFCCLKSQKL